MNKLNLNFFKTLSFSELGLWLIIPLASLTSHTWLPLPPTMMLFVLAIICWLFSGFMMKKNQQFERNNLSKDLQPAFVQGIALVGMFSFYLFASQYLINAAFRHYLGAVLAPLYFVLILFFSKNTSTDFLKNLGLKFIHYTIIIFCIEAVLRYGNNIWILSQDLNYKAGIYLFKFNSPIYLTSNAVAAHLVALLFFMLWWGRTHNQQMKKDVFVTFILIALTLSRVSIPAVVFGLGYYYFFKNLNWKQSICFLFFFAILAGSGIWALKFSYTDYSFQSKFTIINEALEYYQTASLKQILFGLGFAETVHLMTFYAHNYFLLYLMESGVFGLLFLLATLFFFIKTTNGEAMIVIVPFLIQTSTESSTFYPYLYVIMALMMTTKHRGATNNTQLK